MSAKFSLKSNRNQYELILNDSGADLFKNSRYIVNKFINDSGLPILYIAVQFHDQDMDDESKLLKTPHYHVVIQLEKSINAKNLIRFTAELFKCNEIQISIDECISLVKKTRYLCHLDNFDRHQYEIQDIVSNDYPFMMKLINTIQIKDVDDVINMVHQYKNLETLMRKMGNQYKKWRVIIQDLRKEIYGY